MVVVGDHGEMLGEHGEQTHGFFIYEPATHIPLIVSGPGVPARVVPDQVRIVDVMPTALDLLGVPVPKPVQGVSLLPLARGEHLALVAHSESWYPRYHYGWSELRSVQDGRFKYIRAPRPELYDLDNDRTEEKDRSKDDVARLDTLARALDELEARTASTEAPQGPQAGGRRDRGAPGRPRLRRGQREHEGTSKSGRGAIPRTRSASTTS